MNHCLKITILLTYLNEGMNCILPLFFYVQLTILLIVGLLAYEIN